MCSVSPKAGCDRFRLLALALRLLQACHLLCLGLLQLVKLLYLLVLFQLFLRKLQGRIPTIRDSAALSSELRVRFQIIGNARIKNVGKSQSCMVSKLPIIWKQTVAEGLEVTPASATSARAAQPESTVSAYRAQKLLERRKQVRADIIGHARINM